MTSEDKNADAQLMHELETLRGQVQTLQQQEKTYRKHIARLKHLTDGLAALNTIASISINLFDLAELAAVALDTILRMWQANAGWIITSVAPPYQPSPQVVARIGTPPASPESFAQTCLTCHHFMVDGNMQAVTDVPSTCPVLTHQAETSHSRSPTHICIPLLTRGGVQGIATIFWQDSAKRPQIDNTLLKAISLQLGTALFNVRLYQAVSQTDRLQMLTEFDQKLISTLDLQTILQITLQTMATAASMQSGILWEGTRSAIEYTLMLADGHIRIIGQDTGAGSLQALGRYLQSVITEITWMTDKDLDEMEYSFPPDFIRGGRVLLVPIKDEQHIIAVLALGNWAAASYDDMLLPLLASIAARAAQAIRNAQLFAAEQTRREQAVILQRLTNELSHTWFDLDGLVEYILDHIQYLVSYDHAIIISIDKGYGRVIGARGEAATKQDVVEALHFPMGQMSFLNDMYQKGHPMVVSDISTHPEWAAIADMLNTASIEGLDIAQIRACAWLPMHVEGKNVGIVFLSSATPGRFDSLPVATLQVLINQAAAALQNTRLYEQVQEHIQHLDMLNTFSMAMISSLDPQTVLSTALEQICRVLDALHGSILLRDPKSDELVFEVSLSTEMDRLKGFRLAPGQGVAGWVAQHGESVYINDVSQDERFFSGVDELAAHQTHSLVCAPLRYRDEILGVIEIVNKRNGKFTQYDLSIIEDVAPVVAMALVNARLYANVEKRAGELQALNEIGIALTRTLDSATVVHIALHHVSNLFQADSVSLLRLNSTGEICFLRTLYGETEQEIPVCFQPGEGIIGWAVEHQEAILVEDAQTDPRYSGRAESHMIVLPRAVMVAPLITPKRVIGAISLSHNSPGIYTHDDLHTFQAIASALTVALENSRLYEELKVSLQERERTQAQLIQSEKMAALGRLVSSIAHEINNPLQAVQGYITLSREEVIGGMRREKLERYLGIVDEELNRVATLVRQMREFYRPAQKVRKMTDVGMLLEDVLFLLDKQLQHNHVSVEYTRTELPPVKINPDHFKQVFLNLILNAMDAMPDGGTIQIRMETTHMPVSNTGQNAATIPAVQIAFTDTGIGIPSETLPHIFEPFFTTKTHGSGLGLSTIYEIVIAHGGNLTVESEVGRGTTFTIVVPA